MQAVFTRCMEIAPVPVTPRHASPQHGEWVLLTTNTDVSPDNYTTLSVATASSPRRVVLLRHWSPGAGVFRRTLQCPGLAAASDVPALHGCTWCSVKSLPHVEIIVASIGKIIDVPHWQKLYLAGRSLNNDILIK